MSVALSIHAAAIAWCAVVRIEPASRSVSLRGETLTLQAAFISAPAPTTMETEPVTEESWEETTVVVEPQAIQVGQKRFDRESTRFETDRASLVDSETRPVSSPVARAEAVEPSDRRPTKPPRPIRPTEHSLRPSIAQIPRRVGSPDRDRQPEFSYSPPPQFPQAAINAGMVGTVVLAVTIDPDGRVTRVEVERSSGFSILDGAAVAAVRRWVARPLTEIGRDTPWTINLPVVFRLPR